MNVLKRVFQVGLGALGILLLVGAAFFAEAHLEMRQVAPELPDRLVLVDLSAGNAGPVSLQYVQSGLQSRAGGAPSTTGGFLLEWADGRVFAIDLGMDVPEMRTFGEGLELAMGADPVQAFGSVAQQLGADVGRVKGVGFTHLHIDHTQGAIDLCAARSEARIPVFQTPDQFERQNYTTSGGKSAVSEAGCLETQLLDTVGPLFAIPGFPGLSAFAAGGHTPGSTVFVARVDGNLLVFAGDLTNRHVDLMENRGKGFVYSVLMIPENTHQLGRLRVWLAELHRPPQVQVIVSHDHDATQAAGIPFRAALE